VHQQHEHSQRLVGAVHGVVRSRRAVRRHHRVGLALGVTSACQPASPGWMVSLQKLAAQAVQPAYDELVLPLPQQAVLSIDESPTKEGKTKSWIWTFVAATFTLFATRTSRAADILAQSLGEAYTGVIHCDRARMYWSFARLQWCWAHLQRDM